QVTDLDKAERFLNDFGLSTVERDPEELFLRGTGSAPFLYQAALGTESRFLGAGLFVSSLDDLHYLSTLRFIPAREDLDTLAGYADDGHLHRRAIEECPPGHVLVIDSGRNTGVASAGDLMIARLKVRGVAGVVTDGGFRDAPAIRRSGLPAYQRRA